MMITKSLFLYTIFMFCGENLFSQQHFFKYPIYIDVNKQYVYSFNIADSSVVTDVSSSEINGLKLYGLDSSGLFKIYYYDSLKNEKTIGNYLLNPKIRRININIIPFGAGGIKKRKAQFFYFQNAIRIGTWTTYNEQNVEIKKILYPPVKL